MLVKYLGTTYHDKYKKWLPRTEFLENGMFRMTQPKFLNDRGSEAKFYPYFGEYSPADIANARKRFHRFNINSRPDEPSNEHLINFYLKPTGMRYSVEEFPTLLGFTDYNSVEEYNEAQAKNLIKNVRNFNSFILEALSCHIGIFSLSKNAQNELMWVHYANNGEGLVVCFNEDHTFFNELELCEVSYKEEDRASISYVEGTVRINGETFSQFKLPEELDIRSLLTALAPKENYYKQVAKNLCYTKSQKWDYEEEMRLIMPLMSCEDKKGNIVRPNFDSSIPEDIKCYFPPYNEIYLKKIPFDAIESIIFGYATDEVFKALTIDKVRNTPHLKHIKFKQTEFDVRGEIILIDL